MKYSTILLDPPWKVSAGRKMDGYKVVNGKQIWNSSHTKSEPLPYPTMTVEEITNLPVSALMEKDAHLYVWVTNSHLPFIFDIIKAWGFKYSTILVWAKNARGGGLGGAFKITTEFLIFARRGSLKTKEMTIGTWFNVKREYENGVPKHSLKPSFFHELIEKTSPGPYLEMFARKSYKDWAVFGNEVENSIVLPGYEFEDIL